MEQDQKARDAVEMAARIRKLFGSPPKSCVKGRDAFENDVAPSKKHSTQI